MTKNKKLICDGGVKVCLHGYTLSFDGDATYSETDETVCIRGSTLPTTIRETVHGMTQIVTGTTGGIGIQHNFSMGGRKVRPSIHKEKKSAPKKELPDQDRLLAHDVKFTQIECSGASRFECKQHEVLSHKNLRIELNGASVANIGYLAAVKLDGAIYGVSIRDVSAELNGASKLYLNVLTETLRIEANGGSSATCFRFTKSGTFEANGYSDIRGTCAATGCDVDKESNGSSTIAIERDRK
jgi:hypothetical protein